MRLYNDDLKKIVIRELLDQLCPSQMAYWAKNYVTIFTRATHWM